MELCEQLEYQWLYEECMFYLIIENHVHNKDADNDWESLKKTIETLCDLQNQSPDNRYDNTARKVVERYLQYRMNVWGRRIVKDLNNTQ